MNYLRRKRLSRRTFLRGAAGVSMALPFLDIMRPTKAFAGGQAPSRFIGFYVPCGIHMPAWTPADGPLRLSPTLEPLAGFEPYLNVLSGVDNRPGRPDGNGDHAAGTGSFLTARHCFKTQGANIRNGVSIDQLVATQSFAADRFPSLVFASEGGGNVGGCDSGYSCAYIRNISWVDERTPAARTIDPRAAFARLFGADDSGLTPQAAAKRLRQRGSVLDYVRDETTRLRQGLLGVRDQQKLDQYLTGVRELERQIAAAGNLNCDPGGAPAEPADPEAHIRAMLDVIVLAFQCNLSHVATYMLGNGASQRVFPFLGIADNHHLVSHHLENPDNFAKLRQIDRWEVGMLAYLLEGLRAVETEAGNLLDETVVFFSSEIEDGNSHAHDDLPIVLAGGANGQLQGNRHLRYDAHTPIANLFVRLGQMCGLDLNAFGDDSSGALDLG